MTGWSWRDYMATPSYIVTAVVQKMNDDARQRKTKEAAARAARRR